MGFQLKLLIGPLHIAVYTAAIHGSNLFSDMFFLLPRANLFGQVIQTIV
jgi:hypothetical protein